MYIECLSNLLGLLLSFVGNTVCEEILQAKSSGPTEWPRLFEPLLIFEGFKHYLMVEVTASSKEDFEMWEGWVTSRLRLLIRSAGTMVDVRPWPKALKPPAEEPPTTTGTDSAQPGENGAATSSGPRCFYFIGLAKKRPPPKNQYGQGLVIPQSKVDLTPAVNDFAHKVKDWPERKAGMDIFVKHLLQRKLPEWVLKIKARTATTVAEPGAPPSAAEDGVDAGQRKRPAEDHVDVDLPAKRAAVAEAAVAAVERRADLEDWTAEGEGGGGDGVPAVLDGNNGVLEQGLAPLGSDGGLGPQGVKPVEVQYQS